MNGLDCIFNPKSVAIVGASNNTKKWGNWVAQQITGSSQGRRIYFVNTQSDTVLGKPCISQIEQIIGDLDLAVIVVPKSKIEKYVDKLLIKKTKAIIILSSGFAELDQEGKQLQDRISEKCQQSNTVLIGPNCAGVWDSYSKFHCLPIGEFKAGPVAILSQSGGIIVDVYNRLQEVGLGFSRAVSLGNQARTSFNDILPLLEQDPNTKVIAMYVENTDSIPYSYIELMSKPVLILSPRSTSKARNAALQHTNSSLNHNTKLKIHSIRDLVAATQLALYNKKLLGKKISIVTDTGGLGVMLSSYAEQLGLEIVFYKDLIGVPSGFSEDSVDILRQLLVSKTNCIVMNFHLENDKDEYAVGLKLAQLANQSLIPVIFSCRSFESFGVRALLTEGVPVYRDIETVIQMVGMSCGL